MIKLTLQLLATTLIMFMVSSCVYNKTENSTKLISFEEDFDTLYEYCEKKSKLEIGITQKASEYYYKNLKSIKKSNNKQEKIIDEIYYLIEPYELFRELGCSLLSANKNQAHIRHMLRKYIDGVTRHKIYTVVISNKEFNYKTFEQFIDMYDDRFDELELTDQNWELWYKEFDMVYLKYSNDNIEGYKDFINVDSIASFHGDMNSLLKKYKK